MSEYHFVEKPFLDQLEQLGWECIDQGLGIPKDPTKSFRKSFREVALKEQFLQSVKTINTFKGKEWLTDRQLEELFAEITEHSTKNLLEVNKTIFGLLVNGTTVDKNEISGEEFPKVQFIDFKKPSNNSFIAINQFRIDTPGTPKGFITPDIVLFVNGLPLVVVECKDQNEYTANPLIEAYKQLRRYSNQRVETQEAGLKEGEERLFYFNQLCIATYGDDATYGTITSTDQYYLNWKDIYPETLKTYNPPLGKERRQEQLIQGMLFKDNFLDLVQNFTLFMEASEGKEIKIVSRYQQFRAVQKIKERLIKGDTPKERSGVIWHTQGSGKSLTMVFLIKKIRTVPAISDYKIIIVNDRTNLEEQLGNTAHYTGEKVDYVSRIGDLKPKLSSDNSNITMVMLQKFQERDTYQTPNYMLDKVAEPIPKYGDFGIVNTSDRILILQDESHRTVNSDLGDNMFAAFPNSTKIAFTGTPLITDRHKTKTVDRFGDYIDKYKLQDAVDDGATVQILYEGKTADTALNEKALFDRKFEDLFKERTEEELLAIKKKYGTYGDILEAEERIKLIAKDMVDHYVTNILPNAFKAQVVCSSKLAAVRYKKYIDIALKEIIEQKEAADDYDSESLKKLKFLKSAVVVSSDDTNELAEITQARKDSKALNAVENFKKKINYEEPNTGIAFVVVCDMLLTGFDAPIEQIMYLDKKLKEHNLLQAIARVNRIYTEKNRGYIVDYIGLANNLKDALSIYGGDAFDEVMQGMKDIETEVPILESRYRRLLQLFKDNKVDYFEEFVNQKIKDGLQEYNVLEAAIDLMQDIKLRANFTTFLKAFQESMDIILPNEAATPYKIPAKRFGYLLVKTKERYKDDTLNITGAGNKIKRLVNEHLISLGINPKIPPTELFSSNFIEELDKNKTAKAKASEMEHATRKHIKVNLADDPVFYKTMSEKLDSIIQSHWEDWDAILEGLIDLRADIEAGRKEGSIEGVSVEEAPFYDLIIDIAYGKEATNEVMHQLKSVITQILPLVKKEIRIARFWKKKDEVEKLRGKIEDIILVIAGELNLDPVIDKTDKIVSEILALAKKRHHNLLNDNNV
ncbi:MAG: deoxyribonuclease HsdR [Pseudozobellia sp.]|nr:deoxyribonuclease HsdR [Pseudozobellia sp.]MBG46934.1 deoxyribonuclease HsdR [Pseudozobellia sp.]|tara:strand:+ start:972305 stop:975559 length:3255 start_codon:yes stop_codon:yes gene_type:complete